jgi:hypothetical protein
VAADQWSVDLLATSIGLPLTPPYSPPTITVEDDVTKVELVNDDVFGPILERPTSPPLSAVFEETMQLPPDMTLSYPLSRTWSLHYSYTGTPALAPGQLPRTRIASTPVAGVLANLPAIRSRVAEEYSHGLVRLYTAATVEDLLGSWKALRRAIAYKKGRNIEPPVTPTSDGMEGLGVGFMPDDTNFHFFLQNVTPMWEDEMCKSGGKVMFTGSPHQVSLPPATLGRLSK